MIRRGLLVLGVLAGATSLLPMAAADAATHPIGHMAAAQNTSTHRLTVHGWAYDPAKSSASIVVKVYVDGKYATRVRAKSASKSMDKAYRISGKHAYSTTFTWAKRAAKVTVRSGGIHTNGPRTTLATHAPTHVTTSPGARIVAIAKRYVGKARYVEGGASPRSGFDCSGYTKYVYAQAKIKTLPHNAEAQRHMKGMRIISASKARPGDLVFYLSSGNAYHVAIYAGHHMQYAAATARDGIRYQAIWSSAVQYGTDWH